MAVGTIQIRRDTAAAWQSANPILADGELAKDDAGNLYVGDNVTRKNSLKPVAGPTVNLPMVETVRTVAASGAAQTIPDPATGVTMTIITLTAAPCALTFPTAGAGKSFVLALAQDVNGARTVTWPATLLKWSGGIPVLTATPYKTDLFSFICLDGINWFGVTGGLGF